MTLSTDEFVRRWCLHIQPRQLTKSRCFGGWNHSKRKRYQAVMSACIEVDECSQENDWQSTDSSIDSATQADRAKLSCESCGSESLTLSALSPKPSWSKVLGLDSQCSPWWWGESQERNEKQQWDEAMGAGFYDWYVAEVLRPPESAKETAPPITAAITQLFLRGLDWQPESTGYYFADSF